MNGNRCLHRASGRPRRCKRRGCKVWLSSYNPDDQCCEHGGWRPRHEAVNSSNAETRGQLLAEVLAA